MDFDPALTTAELETREEKLVVLLRQCLNREAFRVDKKEDDSAEIRSVCLFDIVTGFAAASKRLEEGRLLRQAAGGAGPSMTQVGTDLDGLTIAEYDALPQLMAMDGGVDPNMPDESNREEKLVLLLRHCLTSQASEKPDTDVRSEVLQDVAGAFLEASQKLRARRLMHKLRVQRADLTHGAGRSKKQLTVHEATEAPQPATELDSPTGDEAAARCVDPALDDEDYEEKLLLLMTQGLTSEKLRIQSLEPPEDGVHTRSEALSDMAKALTSASKKLAERRLVQRIAKQRRRLTGECDDLPQPAVKRARLDDAARP